MYQAVGDPNMSMRKVLGYLALSAVSHHRAVERWRISRVGDSQPPSPAGQEVSRPFGGVRRDIEWVQVGQVPRINLVYVADLPLSLVGDLVTLPKTVIGTQSDSLLQGSGPVQGVQTLRDSGSPGATP